MAGYLEDLRKLEKSFLGLALEHIPHADNQEADDITKRASRQEHQRPGVFEERLLKTLAVPLSDNDMILSEDLPPAPSTGAPDCGMPSGNHLL